MDLLDQSGDRVVVSSREYSVTKFRDRSGGCDRAAQCVSNRFASIGHADAVS